MVAGDIAASGVYQFIYDATLNGAAGGWLILNPEAHVGLILLSRKTASASATIDFTSADGVDNTKYDSYMVVATNVIPTTNSVNLLLQTSVAGVFDVAGYSWQNIRWSTSVSAVTGQTDVGTGIALNAASADNMANTLGGSWSIHIYECSQITQRKRVTYEGYYFGSLDLGISGSGKSPNTSAVDGFRFIMDSGTIASGTFALYGLKKA